MTSSNQQSMKPGKVTRLADCVADAIVSRTLVKNNAGNVTYMAFGAGQGLSEHSAPFDAFVQAVEGKATIVIGGNDMELLSGEAVLMPAHVLHEIRTSEDFKMLLVMLKPN